MAETLTYLTLDKKGRATLPEEVREALGVGAGDILVLEQTERGTYELVPANLVPRDQLWFYHPEMQERMRRAAADRAAGRLTTTRSAAETQAHLDSLKARRRPLRKKQQ